MDRYQAVTRVLTAVFFLNLLVAAAKIGLGLATGAVSILSDGFHSLTDTASNVVAYVGVRLARRPPDADHPYGHRKFETMASLGILVFLLLVVIEVLSAAWERLQDNTVPEVGPLTFWVMGGTFLVNLAVMRYERREGRRLQSEVLIADSHHTQSDLLTSGTVIAALVGVRLGYTQLDPIAAIIVAGFIGYACWEIFQGTSRVLSDRIVLDEAAVQQVIAEVPQVLGCHHIRTRGSSDFVFLDLHIWLDPAMRLDEAHAISHEVKDRLMGRIPAIKDAIIHIEPPPGIVGS